MSFVRNSTVWLAALIWLGACSAQAQRPIDAESKVLALERLWGEAAQLRDIKALESIFDDSLAYVHIDGRLMTKAEVLEDTKVASVVIIVVESQTAHLHGSTVIVSGVLRLKGIEGGKPYLRRARFVDTWLDKKGHWLCVSSMSTPMQD